MRPYISKYKVSVTIKGDLRLKRSPESVFKLDLSFIMCAALETTIKNTQENHLD